MHRAGFEPAPPKRVGLESTALDHSAIGAFQNTIGTVSIHTPGKIDKQSIWDSFAVSIFEMVLNNVTYSVPKQNSKWSL